jgi:hypothetical protein
MSVSASTGTSCPRLIGRLSSRFVFPRQKSALDSSADLPKLDYAIQFLAVSAMAATKTSVIQFYQRIAPIGQTRTLYLLFAMVAVWTVFSVFAQAFSCGLPNLWNHLPNDCSAQFSLRYAITSLNILTDAILGLGFLPVIWKLQTSFNRRVTVMALFASRLV